MSFFAASPFLTALGWALLNSLWQFAACWLIYRTITTSFKTLTAPAKHTISLLLLFAGAIVFIAGLSWKYYAGAGSSAISHAPVQIESNTYYTILHTADSTMDTILPYWSLLYLICVVFLFIKFCLFVRRADKLQKNGITKMNAEWRMYVKHIAAQLGIKKDVKAMLSVHIDTPQVIGFLKPVILLPAACLANLTTEQLEAVLLHELVHIKRHDYLINLFITSAEILFFFNPFVKQMTAAIRREREYSCDDMVIQFKYHPHNYASALLMLEKSRLLPVTYGIAASGKNQQQLLTRIERIMGIPTKQTGIYKLGACLLALLLLGFIATINPAKVAVDNFGAGSLALALTDNNMTDAHYNDEASPHISNTNGPVMAAKENSTIKKQENNTGATESKNDDPDYQSDKYLVADDQENNGNDDEDVNVQTAAQKETIDFSLPQKAPAIIPAAPEMVEEPYVPASSFSFQVTQDTAIPKTKGLTYSERMASEALLKAQKAIEQINWQKIEKQLNYSKRQIAKLKKELAGQIQNLNWQQINNDVKEQLGQEQLDKLHETLKQEQTLKIYQQTEAYNEALQLRLAEQEQLLKETSQRARQSQSAADQQKKKLEQDMKKKRVIYI